jgi:uncharacterized protein YegJ (DUF2314 family)
MAKRVPTDRAPARYTRQRGARAAGAGGHDAATRKPPHVSPAVQLTGRPRRVMRLRRFCLLSAVLSTSVGCDQQPRPPIRLATATDSGIVPHLFFPPGIPGGRGTVVYGPPDSTVAAFGRDSDVLVRARARARCTLPELVRRIRFPPPTQAEVAIQGRFAEAGAIEDLWMTPASTLLDSLVIGSLTSRPGVIRRLRYGDTVVIRPASIVDWYAIDHDTLVGGFTLRAIRNSLSETERERQDRARGYTIRGDGLSFGSQSYDCTHELPPQGFVRLRGVANERSDAHPSQHR